MKTIGLLVALLLSGAVAQRIGQTAPDFKLADLAEGKVVGVQAGAVNMDLFKQELAQAGLQ